MEAIQECGFEGVKEDYRWSFTYDALGNKLRQMDPLHNQSDQSFDPLGRLIEAKLPGVPVSSDGKVTPTLTRPVIGYAYNAMGNRTKETDARGNVMNSEYDELGRLIRTWVELSDGKKVETKHFYDSRGNRIKTIDPKNNEWLYTYSARGWLLTETVPGEEQYTTRYQYDVLGNKIAVTDPRGNGTDGLFTTKYEYDDLNEAPRCAISLRR